jgi:glycosyltransferase involved in cell wall biosynthesis
MAAPNEGEYRTKTDDDRSGVTLRIMTETLSLDPVGGIEMCTFEDSLGLAARGHAIDVMYKDDGLLRHRFEGAGVVLKGPVTFDFNVRHPLNGLTRFVGPARWARSRDPDILLISRFEDIYWAAAIATWSRCPIVCQLHHMPNEFRLSRLQHRVAHFVAVSNFMREAWIGAGLDAERVSVIVNALPPGGYPRGGLLERSAARERIGLSEDVNIVLCYGRMLREKGVGTLLKAWAELGLSPDEAQLVLVGSTTLLDDPELAQLFGQLNPASIHLFPMQIDVVPFLHAADVVVFPTWLEEGFGRVVLEGLATGRPVIASRVGAVPEILSGAMTRFLVEPQNSSELRDAIASLLNWRRTEPELELECAQWVEARYSFEDHISAMENVLMRFRRRR